MAGPVAVHEIEGVYDVQIRNADLVQIQEEFGKPPAGEGREVQLGLVGAGDVAEAVFHRAGQDGKHVGLENREVEDEIGLKDELGDDELVGVLTSSR